MEALIMEKPAMKLAGLATKVTLNDVLENKTTLKVASNFLERRTEIKNCIIEEKCLDFQQTQKIIILTQTTLNTL